MGFEPSILLSPAGLTAAASAFAASAVEMIEAFTIVLAVSVLRGPRTALAGAGAALAVLTVAVALFAPVLKLIPLDSLRLVVGVLILLFGAGWLRKAVLRAGGVLPLHDEDALFAEEQRRLGDAGGARGRIDPIGALTAFKAVLLEGTEVVFIVVAVGAGPGLLAPAVGGAAAALALVGLVGVAVHKPLSQIPENTLKFVVGVMLCGFGVFWTGEGLGVDWPGGDLALAYTAGGFLLAALAATTWLRGRTRVAA